MPYNLPPTGDSQKKLKVLLIEPDVTPEAYRQWLLAKRNNLLTVVNSVRSLFLLGQDHTVAIAILNDVIGQVPLRTAAESVRRRWPLATILVIGQAAPALEDHLYDETVSHGLTQACFLDAVHQLTTNGKAVKLPEGSDHTVLASPTLMESDPSKTPHPVRVAMPERGDMPGGAYRMQTAKW